MKRVVVCLLTYLCFIGTTSAFATENLLNAVWSTNVNYGGGYIISIFDFDIGYSAYYYSVNGVAIYSNGLEEACSGTGFFDRNGKFVIGVNCGPASHVLSLDKNNFNGPVLTTDLDGRIINSSATLSAVY